MFFIVVDVHSFKSYLLENFSFRIRAAFPLRVICAVRKDVDVVLSVLFRVHHWL
jgi:hypothetical protein